MLRFRALLKRGLSHLPFVGFPTTLVIPLKGRISLEADPEGFLANFDHLLKNADQGLESVVIDLREAEFIYPSALIFILGLVDHPNCIDCEMRLDIHVGSPIHEYLLYAGVGGLVEMPPLPDGHNSHLNSDSKVVPIRTDKSIHDTQVFAENLVDLIKDQQNLSAVVEAKLIDSVDEIIRNSAQHSSMTRLATLGQSYPKSQRIRIALADNGVGIKAHLTRRPYAQTPEEFRQVVSEETFDQLTAGSSELSIVEAARKFVSGSDYKNNSGAGLDFLIHKVSVPLNGHVMIMSGNGFVCWNSGTIEKSVSLPYSIPGTLVAWTIDTEPGTVLQYKNES